MKEGTEELDWCCILVIGIVPSKGEDKNLSVITVSEDEIHEVTVAYRVTVTVRRVWIAAWASLSEVSRGS